jgi:chemotaxis protein MotB
VARRKGGGGEGGGGGHDAGGGLRWLLTYADMITLLMAFFIMMYSMSVLNLQKVREVAFSIRSGFGGPLEGGSYGRVPEGKPTIREPILSTVPTGRLPDVTEELERYIKKRRLQKQVHTRVEERGLVVSLVSDYVLFDIGSADIRPSARPLLDTIAKIIEELPNAITVKGHTCSLPIRTVRFPSNWELSTQRATAVVRCFLERHGLPADRLAAAGYADSKPLMANDTEAHRKRNCRVDIVILKSMREWEQEWAQRRDSPDIEGPPKVPVMEITGPDLIQTSED